MTVSGLNNPNIIHIDGYGIGAMAYNGTVTNNVKYLSLRKSSNKFFYF